MYISKLFGTYVQIHDTAMLYYIKIEQQWRPFASVLFAIFLFIHLNILILSSENWHRDRLQSEFRFSNTARVFSEVYTPRRFFPSVFVLDIYRPSSLRFWYVCFIYDSFDSHLTKKRTRGQCFPGKSKLFVESLSQASKIKWKEDPLQLVVYT